MAGILLKALLDPLKDVSGDALVEIAKNPRTKAVIEDSKFAYQYAKATQPSNLIDDALIRPGQRYSDHTTGSIRAPDGAGAFGCHLF